MIKLACLTLWLSFPGLALADSKPDSAEPTLTGLTMAFGLGFGVGDGQLQKPDGPNPPDPIASHQIPFTLGLGYRPIPIISLGVVLGVGPIDCSADCSGLDTRLGGEGRLHITPNRSSSPWISLGFGHEWYRTERTTWKGTLLASGYDIDLQIGYDLRISPHWTLGPSFGLRMGKYGSVFTYTRERGGTPRESDIPIANQATHGWFVFGLRLAGTRSKR
jgi:hypothetical protein